MAAVLLVLGAVACSGENGADDASGNLAGGTAIPGAGEEFDGCRLIQRWDAHEILRGSVRPAQKPAEHPAAATCAWEVQEGDAARSLQFSVFRGRELYGADALEDDPTFERVDEVEDDAFFVEVSGVQLHFLVGDFSVVMSVTGFEAEGPMDPETVKAQLIELAKRVVRPL